MESMSLASFTWQSVARTDVGNIRSINEDSFIERNDINLWAVADGMGGHQGGEVASQLIVDGLRQLPSEIHSLSNYVDIVESSLLDANTKLRQMSEAQFSNRTIGSTVMCMMAHNNHIAYIWAGDSRLYRLRDGNFTQLSVDHSEVQRLLEEGMIEASAMENHPAANVVTKAIGGQESLALQVSLDDIESSDVYLLCSDGLYRDISEEELGDIIRDNDIDSAGNELVDLALSRTGADNLTLVLARAEAV
jgi:serine/threonine protein phosphatase PrpC